MTYAVNQFRTLATVTERPSFTNTDEGGRTNTYTEVGTVWGHLEKKKVGGLHPIVIDGRQTMSGTYEDKDVTHKFTCRFTEELSTDRFLEVTDFAGTERRYRIHTVDSPENRTELSVCDIEYVENVT